MQNKFLLPLIITLFVPFLVRAEWIPLSKGNTTPAPPKVTLVSDDNSSTVIKIEISGFDLNDFSSDGKTYQKADLLTESFTVNPGFPELPYISKVLAIPDQAGLSVEVLETGSIQIFENIYLPPARMSWFEGAPEPSYSENIDAYHSNDVFPHGFAKIDPPSVFRDFRIARISVLSFTICFC
jgi:hypothetical protein